jgi:hypothetical protein
LAKQVVLTGLLSEPKVCSTQQEPVVLASDGGGLGTGIEADMGDGIGLGTEADMGTGIEADMGTGIEADMGDGDGAGEAPGDGVRPEVYLYETSFVLSANSSLLPVFEASAS